MMNPNPNDAVELFFDHVGIAVADIEAGGAILTGVLGPLSWTQRFDDARLGVAVRFARDRSGMVYELIAPLGDTSPIARTLKSRANLLNHMAYRTSSLDSALKQARAMRALPVGAAAPALAFGGATVQFLMLPLGFLIELIEADRIVHDFS
jgi:methylmalonyl-CoA/ethylmalonyl-CoA epimerase